MMHKCHIAECEETFNGEGELYFHQALQHHQSFFQCKICQSPKRLFQTVEELKEHMKCVHNENLVSVLFVELIFESPAPCFEEVRQSLSVHIW